MSRLLIMILSMLVSTALYADVVCADGDAPAMINKLDDYEIIATNDSTIATAQAFKGKQLTYSIKYHVKNSKNKIHIDPKTGTISVKAESTDDFDVNVTATNSCGSASAKFNIVIDEEQ